MPDDRAIPAAVVLGDLEALETFLRHGTAQQALYYVLGLREQIETGVYPAPHPRTSAPGARLRLVRQEVRE